MATWAIKWLKWAAFLFLKAISLDIKIKKYWIQSFLSFSYIPVKKMKEL